MAIEFNITAVDKFFLGEDKILELTVFGQDGITPLDVTGMSLEWSLKKADKTLDPGLIEKTTAAGNITVIGVYNVIPATNTQRVWISFAANDTDPTVTSLLVTPYSLKANIAYRHSLKRMDINNEGILSYGSITFLQATEH